jgi:hypothetical protein
MDPWKETSKKSKISLNKERMNYLVRIDLSITNIRARTIRGNAEIANLGYGLG